MSDAGGALRIDDLRCAPTLAMRRTDDAVYLVGTAASPLGGDDVTLSVEVCPGASLRVRSVAAAVVRPGPGGRPARLRLTVSVGTDAQLRWEPEPGVPGAGSTMLTQAEISLAATARLWWRDEVVLGRFGERPGRWSSSLHVERAGRPLLHHEVVVDADHGPAVAAPGHRALGSVLAVGDAPQAAVVRADDGVAVALRLAGADAALISAAARDHPALRRLLRTMAGARQTPSAPEPVGHEE